MSGYIYTIDDGEEFSIIVDGKESQSYWLLYSNIQKQRNNKVLKELMNNWKEVEKLMRFYISYGVETNDLMTRVSKVYFLSLRSNSEYINDMKQRNNSRKERIKKINKYRNSVKMI